MENEKWIQKFVSSHIQRMDNEAKVHIVHKNNDRRQETPKQATETGRDACPRPGFVPGQSFDLRPGPGYDPGQKSQWRPGPVIVPGRDCPVPGQQKIPFFCIILVGFK